MNFVVIDLSKLAITSKSMCEQVENFRHTTVGKKKFHMHGITHSGNWQRDKCAHTINEFYHLGKSSLLMQLCSFCIA